LCEIWDRRRETSQSPSEDGLGAEHPNRIAIDLPFLTEINLLQASDLSLTSPLAQPATVCLALPWEPCHLQRYRENLEEAKDYEHPQIDL
jgi:hypothetical protein